MTPEDSDRPDPTATGRNFTAYLCSSVLSKLGDALSNPKTVLAWVLATLGTPAGMIAFLVPIRESGSMVPQILLGSWIRRRPGRRDIWIAGSLIQALAILGCAAAAAWASPGVAGIGILAGVIAFSLARSLNSIAGKDVLGRTIPKDRRGRLTGWASGISGLLTLAIGIWFTVRGAGQDSRMFYAGLLALAGSLWIVAALVFGFLQDRGGPVATTSGSSWTDLVQRLELIRHDAPFRRFVLTRSFLLASALSAPFYVMLARESGRGDASLLGSLLVAGGLASSVSSPIWGTWSDRSSRQVLIASAVLTSALGYLLFVLVQFTPETLGRTGVFAVFFFGLGVAHSGVRSGRKIYVVNMAGGVKRTDYVSVSNTLIGILLLVVGGLTSVLSFLGPAAVILVLAILGTIGAVLAGTLPEVE